MRELTSESLVKEYRKRTNPSLLFTRPKTMLGSPNPRRASPNAIPVSRPQTAPEAEHLLPTSRPDLIHLCWQKPDSISQLSKFFHAANVNITDAQNKTPLIHAAIANNIKIATWLLRHRARLDDVDNNGRTALHYAAYYGWWKMVRLLLNANCTPDIRDNEGRTALHLCTGNFDTRVLTMLMKQASDDDLNTLDSEGMVALHWAVLHNRPDHVSILIKRHGLDKRASDIEGKTPLHLSFSHRPCPPQRMFKKPKSCPELLLKADPGMINECDLEQRTTLHQATSENNIPLVELLLSVPGCNLNCQDAARRTPLHYAAVAGYTPLVLLLLSRNADDSLKDFMGATPLHYACSKNHSMAVTAFLDRDSEKTYAPDNEGRHPLVWASAKGHVQTCKTLIDFIIDTRARDKQGATALHAAAFAGQTKCALLLIESGVGVDEIDDLHQTALFRAAERGFVEMASALLQAQAKVDLIDRDGKSVLHYAALNGNLSVLSMFLANGADNNSKDSTGQTPLICAAINGHTEVIKFLLENGSGINESGEYLALIFDFAGRTALHWAAACNQPRVLELLVARPDLSLNKLQNDGISHFSALDLAVLENNEECAAILADAGAKTAQKVILFATKRLQSFWRKCKREKKLKVHHKKKSKKNTKQRKSKN